MAAARIWNSLKEFYFNMERRPKWNKNVLAAKYLLLHFRRDVWNEIKMF